MSSDLFPCAATGDSPEAALAEVLVAREAWLETARDKKRNLFAEVDEGIQVLADERQGKLQGKLTPRSHAVEWKPAPELTPRQLVALAESRSLVAVLPAMCPRLLPVAHVHHRARNVSPARSPDSGGELRLSWT